MLRRIACVIFTCTSLCIIIRKILFRRVWCTCKSKSITGKTVVITGATSGIGLEVARELAKRGAILILAGRDSHRLNATCEEIIKRSGNEKIISIPLDLESLDSVNHFTQTLKSHVDTVFCLVNNAGCFYLPPKLTQDGIERTFQTNYLSAFYLTHFLLPILISSRHPSRIINVSSLGHTQSHQLPDPELHKSFVDSPANRFRSYCYSKLCLVTFSWSLRQKLLADKNSNTTVHCVDPGNTETNIYRHFPALSNRFAFLLQKPIRYFLIKTPREGAQGIIHAILSPTPVPFYIEDTRESRQINPLIYDEEKQQELWRESWALCQSRELSPKLGLMRNEGSPK